MDDRLQAFRRSFAAGDFSCALPFVRELSRIEDQVERLVRAYERSEANFEHGSGLGLGQGEGVAGRLVKTVATAEKRGRSWGWTWSRENPSLRQMERALLRQNATLTPGQAREVAHLVPRGMKLLVACFADEDLGVATVGVKALLATETIATAWPLWRGATKRTRDEDLIPRLRRWALDDSERDRAFFEIRSPSTVTRHGETRSVDRLNYWHEKVLRIEEWKASARA